MEKLKTFIGLCVCIFVLGLVIGSTLKYNLSIPEIIIYDYNDDFKIINNKLEIIQSLYTSKEISYANPRFATLNVSFENKTTDIISPHCKWEKNQTQRCNTGLNAAIICDSNKYARYFNTTLKNGRLGCVCEKRKCEI